MPSIPIRTGLRRARLRTAFLPHDDEQERCFPERKTALGTVIRRQAADAGPQVGHGRDRADPDQARQGINQARVASGREVLEPLRNGRGSREEWAPPCQRPDRAAGGPVPQAAHRSEAEAGPDGVERQHPPQGIRGRTCLPPQAACGDAGFPCTSEGGGRCATCSVRPIRSIPYEVPALLRSGEAVGYRRAGSPAPGSALGMEP